MLGLSPASRARSTRCGALTATVVALLLLAGGCDDDRHVTFPESGAGTIEGWVSDGLPFDPRDVTISVTDYRQDDIEYGIHVHPDSSGHYAVVVPNGPARVAMRNGCGREMYFRTGGLTYRSNAADSVMVAGETCRVDFACGRVTVDVGMPPDIAHRNVRCGLVEPGESPRNFSACSVNYEERLTTELRFVKPGDYRLVLRDYELGYAYLPATLDSAEAERITVRAGEATPHASEIPSLTALEGTVTGSWQTFGFDPPRIEVWYDEAYMEDVQAENDGSFAAHLLAGGPLRLVVRIQDTWGYIGGCDLASATVFDLASGEQRTGIAHVESGLELTFAGDYDAAQPGVYYDVYDNAGRHLLSTYSLEADANPLRIANLPPGEVRVAVRPAGLLATWQRQYFDRRESLAAADPVTVPAGGQIAQATMILERGGRLRGRLFDTHGEPFSEESLEFCVYASDDSGAPIEIYRSYWGSVYDAESGEYVLNQFADGAYKLRARHVDGLFRWYPGVLAWDDAGVIVIEDHAEVVLEDWLLP